MLEAVKENGQFDINIDQVYVAKVWEESSTDHQNVILNGNNIASQVNIRTVTVVNYPDGSKDVGFGRLLDFKNNLTETSLPLRYMLGNKWANGHDTYQQAKNVMETGVNLIEYVARYDSEGNYMSKGSEFRNTPPMETKVFRFVGIEENILNSSPFGVTEFGVDYSDDSPNYNYLSSSSERKEGRNKVFVGPQGSAKTILVYETTIQNINTPLSSIYIDFDGQFLTESERGLDLKKLCRKHNKKYNEFCTSDIVETYSPEALKRVANESGVYKLKLIINSNGSGNNNFIDVFLESLDEQNLFKKKDIDLEVPIVNFLKKVSSDEDETLKGIFTKETAKAKKAEIKVRLNNPAQLKKILTAVEKTRNRFFKSEGMHTAKEIIEMFLLEDNQIIVIYPPVADIGSNVIDPFSSLVVAFEKLLNEFYFFVENNKKLYDHGFVVDEFQILFPRKISSKDPLAESLQNIRMKMRDLLSKHRKFGFHVWAAFPNQQMVDKLIVDLLSTHERYLMAGMVGSDCEVFLSGISDPVRKQFFKLTKPEKVKIGDELTIKYYYALLAGEQSPFQATGDGNIIKMYPSFITHLKEENET